jgi:hypothetical protein
MKLRSLAVAGSAVAALAVASAPAQALDLGLPVSGTTLGSLALTVDTPAVFLTNFAPGKTATTTGAVLATSTNPTWTLTAKDAAASNAGKMKPTGGTCTGSDTVLTDSLQLAVSGTALTGGQSAGTVTLTGTAQTVASASPTGGPLGVSNVLPLAAAPLTVAYTQTFPDSQKMVEGCVYGLTTTSSIS